MSCLGEQLVRKVEHVDEGHGQSDHLPGWFLCLHQCEAVVGTGRRLAGFLRFYYFDFKIKAIPTPSNVCMQFENYMDNITPDQALDLKKTVVRYLHLRYDGKRRKSPIFNFSVQVKRKSFQLDSGDDPERK